MIFELGCGLKAEPGVHLWVVGRESNCSFCLTRLICEKMWHGKVHGGDDSLPFEVAIINNYGDTE